MTSRWAIRGYINDRYHIPALELTTGNLLEYLSHKDIPETELRLIQDFFTNCELVKYANHQPTQSQASERMIEARQIIDITKGST